MFWYFLGTGGEFGPVYGSEDGSLGSPRRLKVWRVHPLGTININTSSGNLSFSLFCMSWLIWPCKTCLPFGGSSEKILVFNVVFHPLGSLNVWQISWKLGQQVRIQWPWSVCFRYILPEDDKVMTILTIQPLGTMKTKQNCRDSFSRDQDYDYFIRNDHVVGVMLREEFAVQEKYWFILWGPRIGNKFAKFGCCHKRNSLASDIMALDSKIWNVSWTSS